MNVQIVKPVFLISLPRSGSTLLQKLLMSHKEIESVAEPWLLLPFVYAIKKTGSVSEYSHKVGNVAISEFINNLPNGEEDYYLALNDFCTSLYSLQCDSNEHYFLDKTPRYYLIVRELAKIFPQAKFIFLFRNISHVYSSMISSWGNGGFKKLHNNHIDLYEGPRLLTEGYQLLKNKSYAIRYEDLVLDPGKHIKEVCDYLDLTYSDTMLSDFYNQDTKGNLGDKAGVRKYNKISVASLREWQKVIDSKTKKYLFSSYVQSLGDDILSIQGYSKENILKEINNIRVNKLGLVDILDYSITKLYIRFKLNLLASHGQYNGMFLS